MANLNLPPNIDATLELNDSEKAALAAEVASLLAAPEPTSSPIDGGSPEPEPSPSIIQTPDPSPIVITGGSPSGILLFREDMPNSAMTTDDPLFYWSSSGKPHLGQGVDRFGNTKPLMLFEYAGWYESGVSADDKHQSEQGWHLRDGFPHIVQKFWVKIPDNLTSNNPSGSSSNNKFFMIYGDGYSTAGDGSTVGMEFRPDNEGWYTYTKNSNGRLDRLGGDTDPYHFLDIPEDQGRWLQVICEIGCESAPDAADGYINVWQQFQGAALRQTHAVRNKKIRIADAGPPGMAAGKLMGYANSGYIERTRYWMDGFALGTSFDSVYEAA